jgi:hypothetical protein
MALRRAGSCTANHALATAQCRQANTDFEVSCNLHVNS